MLKRMFATLLSVMMVFTFAFVYKPINVSATTTIDDVLFSTKLLMQRLSYRDGEYFAGNWYGYHSPAHAITETSPTKICSCSSYCYNCSCDCGQFYYNSDSSKTNFTGSDWKSGQCLGFACQIGYNIFGSNPYTWDLSTDVSKIKAGDIVYANLTGYTHAIFVTEVSSTAITYVDSNASGPCMVKWDKTMTLSTLKTKLNNTTKSNRLGYIWHAPNNNVSSNYSNGSSSTSTIIYTAVTGNYYLKNNATGTYLCVNDGKDTNTQNISVATKQDTNAFQMNISAVSNGNISAGCKIRPLCSNTRLVNPYADTVISGTNVNLYDNSGDTSQYWLFEKVSNGYIIHNAQNQNCVLSVDGTNVCVSTNTKANSQVWTLENIDYTPTIVNGSYYLKNSSTGTYLCVDDGKDVNTQNVSVATKQDTKAFQMNISAISSENASAGCKIRPLCSSSRLVNPYADTVVSGKNVNIYDASGDLTQNWIFEKISNGYIIHNAQNQDCVLSADGTNVCVLTNSNLPTQVWILEEVDTTSTTITTTEPIVEILMGDINFDNEINSIDIIVLKKFLLCEITFTDIQYNSGDLNCDGLVNIFDLILLKQIFMNTL